MKNAMMILLVTASICTVSLNAAQAQTIFYDDRVDGDVGGSTINDAFTIIGTLPNVNGVYRVSGKAGGAGQPVLDDQEAFNFTAPSTFNITGDGIFDFFGDGPTSILEFQWVWNAWDGGGNELGRFSIAHGFPDRIELTDLPAGMYSFRGFEGIGASPTTTTWFVDIEITGGPVIPEPSTLVLALLGLIGLAGYRLRRRRRVA